MSDGRAGLPQCSIRPGPRRGPALSTSRTASVARWRAPSALIFAQLIGCSSLDDERYYSTLHERGMPPGWMQAGSPAHRSNDFRGTWSCSARPKSGYCSPRQTTVHCLIGRVEGRESPIYEDDANQPNGFLFIALYGVLAPLGKHSWLPRPSP